MKTRTTQPNLSRRKFIVGSATVAGGVAMTARSAVPGRREASAKQARSSMVAYFGLTGHTGPEKPDARTLSSTILPIEPGRGLEPTIATVRGRNAFSRLRMVKAGHSPPWQRPDARDWLRGNGNQRAEP